MPYDPDVMAANLRSLRSRTRMTQEEVAAEVHIDKGSIFNYENGVSSPTFKNACKLADFYHVSLDELGGRRPLRLS